MKQLKTALEARQADIKTKSAAAQQSEEQVKRLEQMLRESQVATDRVQKEFNLLNEKVQKLHHDLEDQIHTNTQLLAENSQKAVELKQKEEDIVAVKVSWVSQPGLSLLLWSVGLHIYVHHCYCGHSSLITVVTIWLLLWSQFGHYCGHNLAITVVAIWSLLWSHFSCYCGHNCVGD